MNSLIHNDFVDIIEYVIYTPINEIYIFPLSFKHLSESKNCCHETGYHRKPRH
jgi:hypothetical protein